MAKKKKCPEVKLTKAEQIAKQYGELSKCCSLLSSVEIPTEEDPYSSMHSGGWRVNRYELTAAGIDAEEVYLHIKRLANKRRLELECELVKLDD